MSMTQRFVLLGILATLICAEASAQTAPPPLRLGATLGAQRTNRNAVVFGPSLEIALSREIFLRGEGLIELGDLNDPLGQNNLIIGPGPHVNHALFGPTFRPASLSLYNVAAGLEAGAMILHSIFAERDFTFRPAAGVFVQAGYLLGNIALALQLRFDASPPIPAGDREGNDVPTTSGRLLLSFEIPIE